MKAWRKQKSQGPGVNRLIKSIRATQPQAPKYLGMLLLLKALIARRSVPRDV